MTVIDWSEFVRHRIISNHGIMRTLLLMLLLMMRRRCKRNVDEWGEEEGKEVKKVKGVQSVNANLLFRTKCQMECEEVGLCHVYQKCNSSKQTNMETNMVTKTHTVRH